MKYIILVNPDGRELLEEEIQHRLKEGWQLQGGVAICQCINSSGVIKTTLAQAMVKTV